MNIRMLKSPESRYRRIAFLGMFALLSSALNLLLPRLGVAIPDWMSGVVTGFCLSVLPVYIYFTARKLNGQKES